MSRLIDSLARRYGSTFWEGEASGASVLTTTYGAAGQESLRQDQTGWGLNAYSGNGIVFGAILARMSLFSEVRFQYQALDDHHLFGSNRPGGLTLLEHPWPNGTTGELLSRMIQDADLAGNCYLWNTGNELVRLPPQQVTIVSQENVDPSGRTWRSVIGYWWDPTMFGGAPNPDHEGAQYFTADEIAHWCADEETEILTADGWKDYTELNAGDEVLTLNHETGLSEWQPVIEKMVFPAQPREMVSMEGKEFSSLTTPNHRWPVEYRISRAGTYGRRWVTSATIGAGDRIPVAAYSADLPAEPKWTDALVETVAWFWTEGRFKSGSQPGIRGRGIQIAQSRKNAANVARIRAALTVLFGASTVRMDKTGPRAESAKCWVESTDDDMVIFSLSANAADVITEHCPQKVVMTAFLRALTLAQLDLFIKVSLLADNNGPTRLGQKNSAMAEQFALACILAGHGVSIRPGAEKKRGYRMTNVRILKKRHFYPQESSRDGSALKIERVDYDGHVWCPRTVNQTWLARRRGSVYFTGNSPIPDPTANWRGMSWLTPVIREITADVALTDYKIQFLNNAATPNILLKYKQKLLPGSIDALRERMAVKHGGMTNAFKTLVLDQGADATIVGNTFEQMNFTTVQAAGENRIIIASGVPGIVIGSKEGLMAATYSNYAQAMRRFADITMRPLWRSVCACLASIVNVPDGSRLWYDTRDIAALQDDNKQRADVLQVQAQAIGELARFGWDPESIIAAVTGNDLTLLKHPGPMVDIMQAVPKASPVALKLARPGDPASPAVPATVAPLPAPPQAAGG
jgi:hypothetical protein